MSISFFFGLCNFLFVKGGYILCLTEEILQAQKKFINRRSIRISSEKIMWTPTPWGKRNR
jgi:hypothetical protein